MPQRTEMTPIMPSTEDLGARDRWARLRLLIIGQLLAAPPPRGELKQRLTELSNQTWRHPLHGGDIRFGVSTLERWLALARRSPDPATLLATVPRADAAHRPAAGDQRRTGGGDQGPVRGAPEVEHVMASLPLHA